MTEVQPENVTFVYAHDEEIEGAIAYDGVVSFWNREHLPRRSGIYLVLTGNEVVYVGKSANIRRRWRNHHKKDSVKSLLFPQIVWSEMPMNEASIQEIELIRRFSPRLNVIYNPLGDSEYIDMPDGLQYFIENEEQGETPEETKDMIDTVAFIIFAISVLVAILGGSAAVAYGATWYILPLLSLLFGAVCIFSGGLAFNYTTSKWGIDEWQAVGAVLTVWILAAAAFVVIGDFLI